MCLKCPNLLPLSVGYCWLPPTLSHLQEVFPKLLSLVWICWIRGLFALMMVMKMMQFFRDSFISEPPCSSSACMTWWRQKKNVSHRNQSSPLQFRKYKNGTHPLPPPTTDSFGDTWTKPPPCPSHPFWVSSLAVERWYNVGLLCAAGLRDRRPHWSLLHVVEVVVHVVAGGRWGGQPNRLMVRWRRGPEGAEARCGGVRWRWAGHGHLWGAGGRAGATLWCPQLGKHGDGVREVGRCGRSVSGSAHLWSECTRKLTEAMTQEGKETPWYLKWMSKSNNTDASYINLHV